MFVTKATISEGKHAKKVLRHGLHRHPKRR
jgi:hypothetical protein